METNAEKEKKIEKGRWMDFFFISCLFLSVCMFNSEKLQRVLKLINYKMYLLCFGLLFAIPITYMHWYGRFISTLLVPVFCFAHSFIRNIFGEIRIHRAYITSQKIAQTTTTNDAVINKYGEKLPIKIRGFKFTYILKSNGCALWFIGIIMYKPLLYIRTGCICRKTRFWSIHKRIVWRFAMKQSIRLVRVSFSFGNKGAR